MRINCIFLIYSLALHLFFCMSVLEAQPPFGGTIFVSPDIIRESDPSSFQSLRYLGRGIRNVYDRRPSAMINIDAYLFVANFSDGFSMEVQVNPEFSHQEAEDEAEKYLGVIGQLPYCLKLDIETVTIHKGFNAFGGGDRNLLIHTEQGEDYIADGILEETFVHEAAHTSLDRRYNNEAWIAAQFQDPEFISVYARDYPDREDIAESFLLYFALRYRSDRISEDLKNTILTTIPHRIDFFDDLDLNVNVALINSDEMTVESNEDEVNFDIHDFMLGPNPISRDQDLIIQFKSNRSIKVEANVYTISGRYVANFHQTFIHQGSEFRPYQLEWSYHDILASCLQNGPYYVFVTFSSNHETIYKKALIGVFL